MSPEKRPYRMKRRAEQEELTRRRITESAAELHGTVGPAHTSISAVADRAGVRRSTVYRHFPDENALFAACTAHWTAENPVPDPTPWTAIGDPDERLRTALGALYPYYRSTEQMMENVLRDEPYVPAVTRGLDAYRGYIAAVTDILLRGRRSRGRARNAQRAAIGHALGFPTWRSLAIEQGLDDDQAVELMARLVGPR